MQHATTDNASCAMTRHYQENFNAVQRLKSPTESKAAAIHIAIKMNKIFIIRKVLPANDLV